MASVITIAGEQLFAAKAQANEQLDIDTFIFANVPNQDPSAPINREEGIPTAHIVYQQNVQQVGRINDNVVVYSTVLDSITGPFEFNWVGLYSSVNQKLVAINHVPTVTKTATAPGAAGNTLNRNFGIEYSGIAELTGISVEPETWQLDFTARLSGMDKLTQQLATDMNGKDWFIEDGLKVVPRATANSFSVTPGVGYVSGLRVELKQEHILIVESYPQFVYVDAWFSGNANSTWSPQLAFTVTNTEMDDYIDPSGTQHYVYKLAVINAADDVEDLRKINALSNNNLAKIDSTVIIAGQQASVLHSPHIITGRVNLANPYWGAPTIDTDSPGVEIHNEIAIQKMLNSGAGKCELNDKKRLIKNTIIMQTAGQQFIGTGKLSAGLIFNGGDIPIIARANWQDINRAGYPSMALKDMLIIDNAESRTNSWSIDLTNGDSSGIDNIMLSAAVGENPSDLYGVALGAAYGSSLPTPSFVCFARNCRLSRAKLLINTSDSYIESNELWGNNRDIALQLGAGGTSVNNNQIVPGSTAGIYLKSQLGHMLDVLRIENNYFDGSYPEYWTGTGILQAPSENSGLLNSIVSGNTFWHLNSSGINVNNLFSSRIVDNQFTDLASTDTPDTPDIYVFSLGGSKIDNTHHRSTIAPKTGENRVNLSPALYLVGNTGYASMSDVAQHVSNRQASNYASSVLINPIVIHEMGRILDRTEVPGHNQGFIAVVNGAPFMSINNVWVPLMS